MTQRILIIDDDPAMLVMTQALLAREGYAVSTSATPFGVSKLVADLHPNLVLLDVNMPALSGGGLFEVLAKSARTSDVPILFYSSNDEDALRQMVTRLGAAGYVCKGELQDLLCKVRLHARA